MNKRDAFSTTALPESQFINTIATGAKSRSKRHRRRSCEGNRIRFCVSVAMRCATALTSDTVLTLIHSISRSCMTVGGTNDNLCSQIGSPSNSTTSKHSNTQVSEVGEELSIEHLRHCSGLSPRHGVCLQFLAHVRQSLEREQSMLLPDTRTRSVTCAARMIRNVTGQYIERPTQLHAV
jgi:hypothetical protein